MSQQLENLGLAMQGFGAGIQGNLPQFQQVQNQKAQMEQQEQQRQQEMQLLQQEQNRELQKEAQKALFQDADRMLNFVNEGDYLNGLAFLRQSRKMAEQIGLPVEEYNRMELLTRAALNGNEEAQENLQDELTIVREIGLGQGVLETPEDSNILSSSDVIDGQVVSIGEDGVPRATPVEGFEQGGKAGDQRSQKIASLSSMLGDTVENPEELATKWVDGVLDVEVLDSGFVRLIDGEAILRGEGENAVYELPINALNGVEQPQDPSIGLYDLADETAGFTSGMQEAYGRLAGNFGLPVPENALEARQTVRMAGQELVRALQQNPRYSEGERKAIADEISISPALFDSPDALKSRMRSIDTNLRRRLEQDTATANDPQMPEDSRAAARDSARNINNFLRLLQVPEKVSSGDLTPEFIETVDASRARQIINDMSDAELNGLSDEAYQALRGKLNAR